MQSQIVKRLNQKLSSIRYCVEQAFGMCKGRFRLFHRPLECARDDITHATKLITAIFTLHNFLIDEEDLDDEENEIEVGRNDRNDIDTENDEENEINDEQDFGTRDILLRHTRWLIE